MYVSKYYSCEQIDQRLLQGYYDDAVAKGFTGNIDEFWALVLSISQLKPLTEEEVDTLVNDILEA